MPLRADCLLPLATLLLSAGAATPQEVQIFTNASQDQLALGSYPVPGGKTLDLSVGIGSSLYHMPGDPPDRFWALSDLSLIHI